MPAVSASVVAIRTNNDRFMLSLPLSHYRRGRRRLGLCWTQDDFLRAPRGDFRHEQLIRIPAVDLVHRAELPETLPGLAEFADDRAVQFHFVDLAGNVPRRGR